MQWLTLLVRVWKQTAGALCGDGLCSLRNESKICPGQEEGIVGLWERLTSGESAGKFRLVNCPRGHEALHGDHTAQAWNHDAQECVPCAKGRECHLDTCVHCSACQMGKYKQVVGTNLCSKCPADTWNDRNGSSAFDDCEACE